MRRTKKSSIQTTIGSLAPPALTELVGSRGVDVIRRIGVSEVKRVVADVLCGINLRDSTELLTRRRIALLNAATLVLFVRGVDAVSDFLGTLPDIASQGLKGRVAKSEQWMLQWLLGLTTKGVQNILRDSHTALDRYKDQFVATHRDLVRQCTREYGPVAGTMTVEGRRVAVSWEFLLRLFCTIGSQTLAIRGSEKSTYGKLFERLVLGTVLQSLGFKHVKYPPEERRNVFWLSSRLGARESDAAVLVSPGKAARFDIGFIDRGNPEISKDKVSRFERELELAGKKHYWATFVIVDRVGERSGLIGQAQAINGTIVQMSMSYWPKEWAKALQQRMGFCSEILRIPDARVDAWLRRKVDATNIESFVEATAELIVAEQDEP